MRVLVTGASGFVGGFLCEHLAAHDYDVIRVSRKPVTAEYPSDGGCEIFVPSIDSRSDWDGKLLGIDVIVHLAAKAHVMKTGRGSKLADFREVNVAGTAKLVRAAGAAGVRRIVYLSTIKVNGESTGASPFTSDQAPKPVDPYGISKYEAECVLRKLEQKFGVEVVIIRPPLIYGSGVKGNLKSLSAAIEAGIPLPLGAIRNRRDLVSIYNLCDLIRVCIEHEDAVGRTFLVADNEALSTAELVRYMAAA
jgi:nucleoside-diphosphate-sugar epimerase